MTFDPTTLAWSGYWRADYPGAAPWPAVSTAGASLANGDLVHEGADPSAGSAQNGKTPATFNGTNNDLQNATLDTTFFTTTAGSIAGVFKAVSATGASGNVYDDATLIRNTNSNEGVSFTFDKGLQGYAYDGAYKSVNSTVPTDGAYHVFRLRWDGVNLGLTVDTNAEITVACGTLTMGGDLMIVGAGYGLIQHFQGSILELGTMAIAMSDANFTSYGQYVQTTYGLALGFPSTADTTSWQRLPLVGGMPFMDGPFLSPVGPTQFESGPATVNIACDMTGTADLAGSLTGAGALASALTGTGAQAANLKGTGVLAAGLTGTAAQSANLTGAGALAAALSGTAAQSANLKGTGALAAGITGGCSVGAALTGAGALASGMTGTCALAGTLSGIVNIACGMTGSCALAGDLRGTGALAAGLTGSSTCTALAIGIRINIVVRSTSVMVGSAHGSAVVLGGIHGGDEIYAMARTAVAIAASARASSLMVGSARSTTSIRGLA